MAPRTLILGLGNTILSDDAAGIIVARKIFERVKAPHIEFCEASYNGWRFIDCVAGYERVIVVDSIVDEKCPPGSCSKVDASHVRPSQAMASHGLGICEAVELGRRSGYTMPERISLYAIGVKNPYEFGELLSFDVECKIPDIVEQIIKEEKLYA